MNESGNKEALDRAVLTRWGGFEAVLELGFLPVPIAFLYFGAQLAADGLTPAELLFVLELMVHKRDERHPYPSYERLARRMGISIPYARKVAAELQRKGCLTRRKRRDPAQIRGHSTVEFDLTPLFERLDMYVRTKGLSAKSSHR
jgi:hypothetical protein